MLDKQSYTVEDIITEGKENFFKRVSPKEPLEIPDLEFTDEENKLMDELMNK